VKRFFLSGIGAAVLWVFASLLLAAVISPWVYQGGKHLAAMAETRELSGFLEWLGAACGRSKFGRFFDRSLLVSALVLLPLLLRRVRRLKADGAPDGRDGKTKVSWQSAVGRIAIGCVISGGLLWGMGVLLEAAGAYLPKAGPPALGRLLRKILLPAAGAALVEEWLFRGILLGLWLRFARPVTACVGTSLLFAFLHFLKPPSGTAIADPGHALAGFELLGKILLHFTEPLFFVTDFATLLVVGLILAWARIRTGGLWFSIGLHAGWIMSLKAFNLLYKDVPGHALRPWGVGDSLRSGVLPLLTLGLTAVVCHFVMRRFAAGRPPV
jgi:membrane protease YdiL (CAAX protease family)